MQGEYFDVPGIPATYVFEKDASVTIVRSTPDPRLKFEGPTTIITVVGGKETEQTFGKNEIKILGRDDSRVIIFKHQTVLTILDPVEIVCNVSRTLIVKMNGRRAKLLDIPQGILMVHHAWESQYIQKDVRIEVKNQTTLYADSDFTKIDALTNLSTQVSSALTISNYPRAPPDLPALKKSYNPSLPDFPITLEFTNSTPYPLTYHSPPPSTTFSIPPFQTHKTPSSLLSPYSILQNTLTISIIDFTQSLTLIQPNSTIIINTDLWGITTANLVQKILKNDILIFKRPWTLISWLDHTELLYPEATTLRQYEPIWRYRGVGSGSVVRYQKGQPVNVHGYASVVALGNTGIRYELRTSYKKISYKNFVPNVGVFYMAGTELVFNGQCRMLFRKNVRYGKGKVFMFRQYDRVKVPKDFFRKIERYE
jgi:hypothetical protein